MSKEAFIAGWDQILATFSDELDCHLGTLKVADGVFGEEARADAHLSGILMSLGKQDEFYLVRLAMAAIKRLAAK